MYPQRLCFKNMMKHFFLFTCVLVEPARTNHGEADNRQGESRSCTACLLNNQHGGGYGIKHVKGCVKGGGSINVLHLFIWEKRKYRDRDRGVLGIVRGYFICDKNDIYSK